MPVDSQSPPEPLEERCRRLEAALLEAEQRAAVLVEANPDPVLVHREGVLCYVNPAAVRLWGVPDAAALIGLDFRGFIHPDDRPVLEERLRATGAGERHPTAEVRLRRPADGRELVIDVQAEPIRYLGEPGTLLVCRDVTERRRAEAARQQLESQVAQAQKVEAIGRMAGGIAHDFNNLLTVILAGSEVAQSTLDPGHPAHAELSTVLDAAVRAADFARQLLAFSRKSTGAPKVVDLSSALAGTVKMLRRLLGEAVHFEFELGEPVWPVFVDQGRLEQVLANLAVNGRDAAAGHGRLTLGVGNVSLRAGQGPAGLLPGPYVRLVLADDGCVLDETTRARILEPFFAAKGPGGGAGLGLASARENIEAMGGGITVESGPDTGTRFHLYLPRHAEAAPTASGPPAPVETPAPSRGHSILVVEDEPTALTLVADLLRRAGYDVLTAPSPTAATAVFKAKGGQVDLLLTDVIMPALDGDQLARQLVALEPGLRVLYMSGYPADILADRLQATPGAGFLPKPFTPTMLYSQVRRLLEGRRRP